MLREVAGEHILIPIGEAAASIQGIMSLNGSGLLLWEKLQTGTSEQELVEALLEEYETTEERAQNDVKIFLEQLEKQDLLI